jgi:hypothetical protein
MRNHKGRKPVHMEMVGGKGSRQRVWEAIRKHAGAFTCYQISRRADADDETVYTYLLSLERGGFLEAEGVNQLRFKTEKKWRLVRDNGVEAPRLTRDGKLVTQGLGTEAMWRSMRILAEFNFRELAAQASTCGVTVSEETVKSYVRFLRLAGYVDETVPVKRRDMLVSQARYRLKPGKYTGPRPPMIQRTKSVYDPNLSKVVWQEEAKSDEDL